MPPCYLPRYAWWPATCVRSIAMRPAARSNGSRPARGRAAKQLSGGLIPRAGEPRRDWRWSFGSHPHDQLAHHLALGERLERCRRLGQRIDLLNMTRQLALGTPVRELIDGGLVLVLVAADPGSPEHAEDGAALQQDQVERQLRDLAGGKADHEMPSLPGERAHRRLAVGAAHRIEHDVDAVLAADTLEPGAQVLGVVVQHLVGAVGAGERELVVTGGAGDHPRAHDPAQFDRGEPDAARSAEHSQGLTRLHPGPMLEGVVGGAVGDGQRRRALEVEIGRELDDLARRDRGAFARRVEVGVAQDAVAGLELGNPGAYALD